MPAALAALELGYDYEGNGQVSYTGCVSFSSYSLAVWYTFMAGLITWLSLRNSRVIYILGQSPGHTDEIHEVRK